MSKSLNHINVSFEIKQVQDEDPEFFVFEGLASTFNNMDSDRDIILPGAFTETIKRRVPVVLWQHDIWEPIGVPDELKETADGLFIRAKLPRKDSLVNGRVIPQMKVGSIRSMSIGFKNIDSDYDSGTETRKIKELELFEISLVTFPANVEALVQDFKTVTRFQELAVASRDTVWDKDAALARVRQFTDSEDSPSSSYRNNFLWYDGAQAENFGSYKFPFVDIINGERTIIPRAINNAKARLADSDIPDSEKPRVLNNINAYQERIDELRPKSAYTVQEVKKFTKRDLEKALRESGFSRDSAVLISSTFATDKRESCLAKELLSSIDSKIDAFCKKKSDVLKC